jgi:crossover junction endodeoxyribonuclease RuvC
VIYVGIDPGQKGGIVAINDDGGVHGWWAMPVNDDGMVIVRRVGEILSAFPTSVICLEKAQSAPGQGVSSTFKYGVGYGMLLAAAQLLPKAMVQCITSPVWKKEVLLGYTHDKAGAIAFVRKTFPAIQLVQPGCRTPHDGIADAACIAEYARRKWSF